MAVPTVPVDAQPWLDELARVMVRAFPLGFDPAMYFPLARILLEYCSFRSAARVLAWLTGKDPAIAYHDVLVADSRPPDEGIVDRLRERLNAAGFEEWVAATEV